MLFKESERKRISSNIASTLQDRETVVVVLLYHHGVLVGQNNNKHLDQEVV